MLQEIKHLPDKRKWFNKWDAIFKADNPRYEPDKFYSYVFGFGL
jgi:hypothetical protein